MNIREITNIKSLLLDNNTIKQTIFKNTFWLSLGVGLSKLLKLFLLVYAARVLGVTEYGKFTFALAFISLFIIFHDFGLPRIVTREFSRDERREKEIYSLFSLKILLGLSALILIFISSFFITTDPFIRKIIFILAFFSLIGGFINLIFAFFQARQKMEYQAGGVILQDLLATVIGIFVLLNFPSIENLSYGYLFSALVALIFILLFFHFKIIPLRIFWQRVIWKRFLKMSWPLALSALVYTLYTYIDSVMMGYRGLITETGWYNAAHKITDVTLIPVNLISVSFYPVLSKFFRESKEKLQEVLNYQTRLMILLVMPLVVGGLVLASKIINFIYGLNFFPSILTFQILIIMTGIIFLYAPFYNLLIIAGQQKKIFYISASGAVINIILNFILIPKLSLYGAAIATLITNLLIFILVLFSVKYFTPFSLFNFQLTKISIFAILATALMYFLIKLPLIYNLNIILTSIIGALTYFAAFFIVSKLLNFHPKNSKLV